MDPHSRLAVLFGLTASILLLLAALALGAGLPQRPADYQLISITAPIGCSGGDALVMRDYGVDFSDPLWRELEEVGGPVFAAAKFEEGPDGFPLAIWVLLPSQAVKTFSYIEALQAGLNTPCAVLRMHKGL